ncbi:hypothetical protein SAMN05216464_101617 [Mucilaginibacter pineti]|uniref:Uncharacterized protein n=1 Tax=Mucilaginibacter pineti TaxID=1391627 RepID=A0A1G6UG49_9SPHI|nr:hypothetical protein SAMN05216464_101617 [Mucilaginibacter pineti]
MNRINETFNIKAKKKYYTYIFNPYIILQDEQSIKAAGQVKLENHYF